jgi:hypothetical protein
MIEPVPTKEPSHEQVNHCQVAPDPKLPSVTVRVLGIPLLVLLLVIVNPVGAIDWEFTMTVVIVELVVGQLPF